IPEIPSSLLPACRRIAAERQLALPWNELLLTRPALWVVSTEIAAFLRRYLGQGANECRRVRRSAYALAGLRSRLLLLRLRLDDLRQRLRRGRALDRTQPARVEGVDSGTRAAQPGDHYHASASGACGDVDAIGRADAANDIAFGVTERHRAALRRRLRRAGIRQGIGVSRATGRSHAGTGAFGAHIIIRRQRPVRGQRRRADRHALDEQAAGAREPLGVLGQQILRARATNHCRGKPQQPQDRPLVKAFSPDKASSPNRHLTG